MLAINNNTAIINATKKWINDVVIGCNFCPFASKVFLNNSIYYVVDNTTKQFSYQKNIAEVILHLQKNKKISTAFIIFCNNYKTFNTYNKMLLNANNYLQKNKWQHEFQIASFHPEYIFEGTLINNASNYTNKSPYPMLHILREAMVSNAINYYKNAAEIPKNNIAFANNKGATYMQALLTACMPK